MKKTVMVGLFVGAVFCATPLMSLAQKPAPGPDMILVKTTAKTSDEVVDAVKAYSDAKKWLYMGATKAKQGEITMVKVCIPEVGKLLWPIGLHLTALLPCGNLGVYQNKGKTEISMLHPSYMQILYPHPQMEKAVDVATPLLLEMFEAVAK